MPDLEHGSKTPQKEPGKQGSLDAGKGKTFSEEVNAVIAKVNEISEQLLEEYPKDGLVWLSKQFEKISKDFTDIIRIEKHPFHAEFHKSEKRQKYTRSVSREATRLALFFERVSKTPTSYSAAKSRIQIRALQAELTNLRNVLSPKAAHS